MKRFLFSILLIITTQSTNGQIDSIEDDIERSIENQESTNDYMDIFDFNPYQTNNKININTASFQNLMLLPGCTPIIANNIINHRNKYGKLFSIYELQAVQGLSIELIKTWIPIIATVEPKKIKINAENINKLGTTDFTILVQRRLELSNGFLPDTISGNSDFLGSPARVVLRYKYTMADRISFGFLAEKDAGEPMIYNNRPFADFKTAYLQLKNTGIISNLIIGGFQASFGQGLTFGSGIAISKSPLVSNIMRIQNGLRPYNATNESNFLKGAGISLQWNKNWQTTFFFSINNADASTNTDTSINSDFFSSESITGLHRTQKEIEKKNTVLKQIVGTNLVYLYKKIRIGYTAIHQSYSIDKSLSNKLYKLYNQDKKKQFVNGIDYRLSFKNIIFFGEAASNNNLSSISSVNGLLIALDKRVDLALLNRHYAKQFQPISSTAFSEFSDRSNEAGTYLGINFYPNQNFKISAYQDIYKSYWLRYRIDGLARGSDYMGEIQYEKRKKYLFYFRIKSETKSTNTNSGLYVANKLVMSIRKSIRLHATIKINDFITTKNRIEYVRHSISNKQTYGNIVFQDIIFKKPNSSFSLTSRIAYFNTNSYEARVYAYENDVLYSFSVPAFQNKGIRFYALFRYQIARKATLWLRYSRTRYHQTEGISSGNDFVGGNKITDVKLQLQLSW